MAESDFTERLEAVLRDLEQKGEAELAACEARRESWSNQAHYYLGWVDALAHLRERLGLPAAGQNRPEQAPPPVR